ncbi:hypothetical protein TGGT1_247720 [Toxoplasma gondii GT1]|uniref:Uncharacterized protein n=3 Tax=Toxoplasma gondii TaxID=5811 RepID=S7W9V5_TOXGG|nr:hypothetical protein TGGT1_247720 [Toxoplasma gondii GT1]KAF4638573.1 hypothetical protein TGRH88_061810 [Toxoplasma gondii]RQX72075.1 hypothetical protein TGCAST_247720 [Toxoplasma gondii CAST]
MAQNQVDNRGRNREPTRTRMSKNSQSPTVQNSDNETYALYFCSSPSLYSPFFSILARFSASSSLASACGSRRLTRTNNLHGSFTFPPRHSKFDFRNSAFSTLPCHLHSFSTDIGTSTALALSAVPYAPKQCPPPPQLVFSVQTLRAFHSVCKASRQVVCAPVGRLARPRAPTTDTLSTKSFSRATLTLTTVPRTTSDCPCKL